MHVYKVRFHLHGKKARWVTGRHDSLESAKEWFSTMLAENYRLSIEEMSQVVKFATFEDVTSKVSSSPRIVYIPESKMFKF